MGLIHAMWRATPWAAAGLAVAVVLALISARPLSRRLRTSAVGTFMWVLALGVTLTLTATPSHSQFTVRVCSLGLARPLPVREMFTLGEASVNVWMFIPLALLSTLPRQGRAMRLALGVTVALPFLIEALQWALPAMGRSCQSQDLVNNLTGVVIGFGVGALLPWGLSRWRGRPGASTVASA